MAPLQGNQFLQLDPELKAPCPLPGVTDPLSHLALLDASSPKGGAFCHLPVSTDKAPPFRGSWQNRQVLPERVPPIAAIRLGLCVKMSLSRPAGRDKLKNIKFIPLIMAERSGAIFQSSPRSASQNFQNMQFMLAKYCFYDVNIVYWYHSPQVLPVKMRLKEKASFSNLTKKEVFYDE